MSADKDPFKGPDVPQRNGGLNLNVATDDGVMLLVAGGVATGSYNLGDIVKLTQTSDLDALDIIAAYDANNEVLVQTHVEEFFKYAPNGTLFLMLVAQGTTMTEMVDKDEEYVKKVILSEDNDNTIKSFGVVLNPVMVSPITGLTIDNGGADYQVGDAIAVTGGGGTSFDAEVATIDGGGAITGITINDNGSGYYEQPTSFTITTAAGAGASFTAVFGDRYDADNTDGVNADALTAVPKAKELINWLWTEHQIIIDHAYIEGRDVGGTIANMEDLLALDCEEVAGLIICQDPVVAALDQAFANYAAVGAAMGMLAIRKTNECLGSAQIANLPPGKEGSETYPLTDAANGRWLTAALSSGVLVSTLSSTDRGVLASKGYIFAGKYRDMAGIFLSDSPACAAEDNDYSKIEMRRTANKARRIIRAALLPRMKAEVDVDDTTGYIDADIVKEWQAYGEKKLNRAMSAQGSNEISGKAKYVIDPKQNVLNTSLVASDVDITPKGVARKIKASVGLVNPFNS